MMITKSFSNIRVAPTLLLGLLWLPLVAWGQTADTDLNKNLPQPSANNDPGEDIEEDALAFSQSELRQISKEGYGVSLLGGAPWMGYGIFQVQPFGNAFLGYLQLGWGNWSLRDDNFDVEHEYLTQTAVTSVQGQYFFSDYFPFFVGSDIGLTYWHSTLKPTHGNSEDFRGSSDDLGLVAGANFGALWITQTQYIWGMHFLNVYHSLILAHFNDSGTNGARHKIQKNLSRGYTQINFSLQFGYLF